MGTVTVEKSGEPVYEEYITGEVLARGIPISPKSLNSRFKIIEYAMDTTTEDVVNYNRRRLAKLGTKEAW